MKNPVTITLLALVLLVSCKHEPKTANTSNDTAQNGAVEAHGNKIDEKEASVAEKLAKINGIDNWGKVEELKFTFNVDREGNPHFERSWIWNTKTNVVTAISAEDTLTYDRNAMDSTAHKTNANFINDKFWLLAPINFTWDKASVTTEHSMNTKAPISKKNMQKLTVTYKGQGGYTPGDAYDVYFGDDFIVQEWIFRKGNQAEPSMTTTWEDYTDKGGLKIAQMHKNEKGDFKLYFTGVEVITE